MIARLGAIAVHLLTASGAVLALLALGAAHRHDWHTMFVWLGAALLIDAADGPLARALKADTVLPRFSGERRDLIGDYLTYVAVPAFALTEATLLPEAVRLPAAISILMSGLFHVADTASTTREGYFVGFPAIWNIVLLYLFALAPAPHLAFAIVALFVLLTFVPLLAVHPFRVARLRPLTALVTALWTVGAALSVANPFPSPLWIQAVLILTAIYLTCVGILRGGSAGNDAPP